MPLPQFWRQTHEGMAIEFLSRWQDGIRYISDLGPDLKGENFAVYNGGYWEFRAKAVAMIGQYQREMTIELRQVASNLMTQCAGNMKALDDIEQALVKFSKTAESTHFKSGWRQELKSFLNLHTALAGFDANPWLLNCSNGTVDLQTGLLQPHSKADLISKTTRLDFIPQSKCPTWERFIKEIFQDDEELIGFVKKAIGYSLTGDTREECIFLCHGNGANGKSKMLGAIRQALGDYSRNAAVKTFMAKGQDPNANNDLAMLASRRFVTTIETNEGQRLDEALVKQASGGDPITARFLFSEYFEFIPAFKLWFGVNHEPEIRGTDDGIWRRILKIPFAVKFWDENDPRAPIDGPFKDEDLKHKLAAEVEGILAWAVQGCLQWRAEGLPKPNAVITATQDYRDDQDVLGHFVDRRCEMGDGLQVKTSDLYRDYLDDAQTNGVKFPLSLNAFGRKLTSRGFIAIRDGDGDRARTGIALKHPKTP